MGTFTIVFTLVAIGKIMIINIFPFSSYYRSTLILFFIRYLLH